MLNLIYSVFAQFSIIVKTASKVSSLILYNRFIFIGEPHILKIMVWQIIGRISMIKLMVEEKEGSWEIGVNLNKEETEVSSLVNIIHN